MIKSNYPCQLGRGCLSTTYAGKGLSTLESGFPQIVKSQEGHFIIPFFFYFHKTRGYLWNLTHNYRKIQ